MPSVRFTVVALLVTAFLALLAGCGDSDSGGSSGDCDRTAIEEAVAAQGTADAPATLDKYGCADGWAYAFATVGSGEEGATVTFVFKDTDGTWEVQDRETVCQSPGDQVPEAIFDDACESN